MIDDLVADWRHMTAAWDAPPRRVVVGALPKLLTQPRFRAVLLVRLAQACWGVRPLRLLAHLLSGRAQRTTGVEIHPGSKIGPGLCLVHGNGIVVGHEVVAGSQLVLFQQTTLGHGGVLPGQPRLGDRVRIGAGAKVLGGVTIGDDAFVGANAVVTADVPAGASVTGVWSRRRAQAGPSISS